MYLFNFSNNNGVLGFWGFGVLGFWLELWENFLLRCWKGIPEYGSFMV